MVGEHHFSAPGASLLPDTGDPGFGIYLHWPFCAAKCPYCDFNSHVRHRPVDQERFTAAFLREMEHMRALSGPRVVTSIFRKVIGFTLDCAAAAHWSCGIF